MDSFFFWLCGISMIICISVCLCGHTQSKARWRHRLCRNCTEKVQKNIPRAVCRTLRRDNGKRKCLKLRSNDRILTKYKTRRRSQKTKTKKRHDILVLDSFVSATLDHIILSDFLCNVFVFWQICFHLLLLVFIKRNQTTAQHIFIID